MKKYPFYSVILLLALAQVILASRVKVFGVGADCFTVALVYAGLFFNIQTVFAGSLLVGALKDIFSGSSFAFNTVLAPVWGYIVFQAARRLTIDSNAIRSGLVFVIAFSNAVVMRLAWWYLGISVPLGVSLRIMVTDSFLTAVVALVIFKALKVR
jgi:hypothetical protein